MKIGIDAREIQKECTGIGRYLLNFLQEAVCREDDHEYLLYHDAAPIQRIIHAKVRHIVLKGAARFLWDHWLLSRAVRKDGIGLFFSPYYKMPLFLTCPSVITVHDLGPLFVPDFDDLRGRMYRLYFRGLVQSSVRRASKVILVSNFSKRCLGDLTDVKDSKLTVVYNGVGKRYQRVEDHSRLQEVRDRFGIHGKYVYYAGNMSPHKNLRMLIEAYAGLQKSLKEDCQLVITGSKKGEYAALKDQVQRCGLDGRVLFTGHVNDDDLISLYSAAETFVFPSLYEGFGLPPLEAMACGAPVISSDAASLKEVLGDAALFVSPGDQVALTRRLEEVLTCPEVRREYIERGLRRAKAFGTDVCADGILQVFASIRHESLEKEGSGNRPDWIPGDP